MAAFRFLVSCTCLGTLAGTLAGCATPAPPTPVLGAWSCDRLDVEAGLVRQRAADLVYSEDRHGSIEVGDSGTAIFWPALLAMRGSAEREELQLLQARHQALMEASRARQCPAHETAARPVQAGERPVYAERSGPGTGETAVRLVVRSWPQRLPPEGDLALGQVVARQIALAGGDPRAQARVRGQVVAVGPQVLADRRFDAAVIDLFGEVESGERTVPLAGAIVVDRASGMLLRLELRSVQTVAGGFELQRQLVRVESAR